MAVILVENRQSGGEDWCYREKFQNFVAWAESDPKTAFVKFLGTLRLTCAQPTGKKLYSEGLSFASLDVSDQAFGIYRPQRVPKCSHGTITKIENLHIDIYKNPLIPKMLFFSIYDEK